MSLIHKNIPYCKSPYCDNHNKKMIIHLLVFIALVTLPLKYLSENVSDKDMSVYYKNMENIVQRQEDTPVNEKEEITIFTAFLIFLIIFIIPGIIKGLLGILWKSSYGAWGMDLIVSHPGKMRKYLEPELSERSLVRDGEGWPVHPDTKQRTVRTMSRVAEMCLNSVFFLIYPCILLAKGCRHLYYLCCMCGEPAKKEDDKLELISRRDDDPHCKYTKECNDIDVNTVLERFHKCKDYFLETKTDTQNSDEPRMKKDAEEKNKRFPLQEDGQSVKDVDENVSNVRECKSDQDIDYFYKNTRQEVGEKTSEDRLEEMCACQQDLDREERGKVKFQENTECGEENEDRSLQRVESLALAVSRSYSVYMSLRGEEAEAAGARGLPAQGQYSIRGRLKRQAPAGYAFVAHHQTLQYWSPASPTEAHLLDPPVQLDARALRVHYPSVSAILQDGRLTSYPRHPCINCKHPIFEIEEKNEETVDGK